MHNCSGKYQSFGQQGKTSLLYFSFYREMGFTVGEKHGFVLQASSLKNDLLLKEVLIITTPAP